MEDQILILWLDAIQGTRSSFKNKDIQMTKLEEFQKRVGGTYYTNAYTITPDTFRSFGVFRTGKYPINSGCIIPNNPDILYMDTDIFQYFLIKGYNVYILTHPILESKDIFRDKKIKKYYEFKNLILDYKRDENLKKVLFYYCFDYHELALIENTLKQERNARDKVGEILFNNLDNILDEFDKVFLFSDHGYTLEANEDDRHSLNEDKLNIIFQVREKKEEKNILKIEENKMVSILDLYINIAILIDNKSKIETDGEIFKEIKKDRILYIEDGFANNQGVYYSQAELLKFYKIGKFSLTEKNIYSLDKIDKKLIQEFKNKTYFLIQNFQLIKAYENYTKGFKKIRYDNKIKDAKIETYKEGKNNLITYLYSDGSYILEKDYYSIASNRMYIKNAKLILKKIKLNQVKDRKIKLKNYLILFLACLGLYRKILYLKRYL